MIIAKELIKDYGEVRAVDAVSFEIQRGECVGMLGLNGAGKSTLLRILSCLLVPTSGSVSIDGHDVSQAPEAVRRLIGYLPEEPPLYGEMTVRKFLEFVAGLRAVPRAEVNDRVLDVARRCQLTDVIDKPIDTLSYGFKKRVGIAQSIVHNPPLVILDEPIAGLDPAQIVEMRELIRHLRGSHTVVLSSHNLPEISQTCDRLMVVHRGRVLFFGSEQEITKGKDRVRVLSVRATGKKDAAAKALDGLAGIESWKALGEDQGELSLEIKLAGDTRAEVSRALVASGLGLLEFTQKADQLESVFLWITGGKEGVA